MASSSTRLTLISATASDGGSEVNNVGAGFAATAVRVLCANAVAETPRHNAIVITNDLKNLFTVKTLS
jgi:hypothetical protein